MTKTQFAETYPFKSKRVIDQKQLDRLLTTKEFSKRFHIVPTTAHRWFKRGKVWATKIGSRWYFDPDSIAH